MVVFPGAIGPEKSEDLPSFDLEAHIIDGGHRAVALGDVLYLDHGHAPSAGAGCRPSGSLTPESLRRVTCRKDADYGGRSSY